MRSHTSTPRISALSALIPLSLCLSTLSAVAQAGSEASDKGAEPERNFVQEREELAKTWEILGIKWGAQSEKPAAAPAAAAALTATKAPMMAPLDITQLQAVEKTAHTSAPERQSLARLSSNGYAEPEELRSRDGTLTAVLVATYARNFIGQDPVYLRSYNGNLVGPTLRAKPGDTLRITLRNDLPTQGWKKDSMNTLHDFNTTNLHTHGLHVSPNGISDNVLLTVEPGATQEYVIHIPKDHTAGTYWYHAHHHGSTAINVASGMSGALIIEGGLDDLPEIKAMKERVMVLNQIPYIYKNFLEVPAKDRKNPKEDEYKKFELPEGIIEDSTVGYQFGPKDWPPLGRFTTVNGVQLPVIRMRPGQVERWRLIASGQREALSLELLSVDPNKAGILFHEIAVDGLALGKALKKKTVALFPGYRSDVLVQAPSKAGEYLLIDQASKGGIDGNNETLKYVARVIVEENEAPMTMALPTDKEMEAFRLPTLMDPDTDKKDKKIHIDKEQTAVYAILPKPNGASGVNFTIDGKSFDMDEARELTLGHTDEWTVTVRNGPNINTGHPFHIHVNPFEVYSVIGPEDPNNPDSKQVEQLKDGPVWRDTIWVPNNGTVKFRTKYTDFVGTFVQHCHILDHEDQGMMQLIDIIHPKSKKTAEVKADAVPRVGTPAPAFDRPDATGRHHVLADYLGKRTVVFLFKGHGCLHCVQQVHEFEQAYAEFAAKGIQVVGITTDTAETLKTALAEDPCPFPILADPEGKAFAAYGCARSNGLTHGTFLIDEKGQVQWRTTGSSPFLGVSQLMDGPPQTTASLSR
jgi:FtsP/CotA-like multicopper oxidase with cupredoxin domain/peroxiredoxin